MASVRKRKRKGGTWAYGVLYDIDGRQTSVTFDTRKQAEQFRDAVNSFGARRAMEVWGIAPVRTHATIGMTVQEWCNHYIDHRTGITKTTLYDYRSYLRNHIAPAIGQMPLTELSRDDIARWVNGLRIKGGPREGQKPSGKSVANWHGFLSAALAAAVEAGKIASNPAANTHLPTTERPDMVCLTRAEFARLLAEIPDHWKPLVEFLVKSGTRFGEATALRPGDVNRQAGTVRITRAWKRTYETGGYELGPPKTKRSRRTISINRPLLDKLDYTGEWLFTNSGANPTQRGGPVRIASFRANVWRPALERVNLDPRPRIHDLRHTCASWLIQSGASLPIVQQHLGHESIDVTIGMYTHLDRSSFDAAATALSDYLAADSSAGPDVSAAQQT